jgi:hypothetical protein
MCAMMILITFDAPFPVPSYFLPLPCSVFVGLRVIGSPVRGLRYVNSISVRHGQLDLPAY